MTNKSLKNPKVVKHKNQKTILLCISEKLKFIKGQEGRGLVKLKFIKEKVTRGSLSKLTGISVPILSDVQIKNVLFQKHKMNAIVNKLLLSRDKFTSEMHLRQSGFTYSACGAFTKNKERIKSFKETGDSIYIDQNELQSR